MKTKAAILALFAPVMAWAQIQITEPPPSETMTTLTVMGNSTLADVMITGTTFIGSDVAGPYFNASGGGLSFVSTGPEGVQILPGNTGSNWLSIKLGDTGAGIGTGLSHTASGEAINFYSNGARKAFLTVNQFSMDGIPFTAYGGSANGLRLNDTNNSNYATMYLDEDVVGNNGRIGWRLGNGARTVALSGDLVLGPGTNAFAGNVALGSSSGNTLTINSGAVIAQNATGTTANSIANVGTLSGMYLTATKELPSPTYVRFVDDFSGGTNVTGQVGETGWNFDQNGAAVSYPADSQFGSVRVATGTVSGNAVRFWPRGGNNVSVSFDTSRVWTFTFRFRLDQTSDCKFVIGVLSSVTPTIATYGFGLRYDSTGHTAFQFSANNNSSVTDVSTGVNADTSWHYVTFRRIGTSTIFASIDGGAEVSLTANVPTSQAGAIAVWLETSANVSKTIGLDYLGYSGSR